jgi:RNA polymerase sigma-70 factor (ECF subfamily)
VTERGFLRDGELQPQSHAKPPRNAEASDGVTPDDASDRSAEDALIVAAKGGDVTAYEQLMRLHESLARRTAFFVTRDNDEAEDAVQEAFLKAWRALPRFQRGMPFRPWILRIVINEARNRGRTRARHLAIAERALSKGGTGLFAAPADHGPLAEAERSQLLAAVAVLSRKHRDVVVCRYFLDLSEEETASVLDLPTGTVKSRLSRALAHLERHLGELRNG